ncbi:uncharacterized protein LOC130202744 [Pseudoliparis swirei]|uniref:uncharacterized protein LOC130202744 n=1 Tax=Pseudoliparis swirei TaxID=2059687 RepID=UPI0024BE17DC|nr:uncharacterized protein LOC130202744 [Pseudoliparis swirei]
MDTCCLEDHKKMDSNKVWQWRVMCGKKLSVCLEPFHHSNRIGLDFNVASNTQKKIDSQLVTNGVILEVCDFAKTVNKSKGHFITSILENNFDLGLENEQQLTDFTAQILHKVKDLIKKPEDKKEVFTLFDLSSKPECKTNNGLNMASAERKTESVEVEMDDTAHGDQYACSQATSKEYMKMESLLEDMEGAHGDDSEDKDGFKGSGAMSAEELIEDAFLPKFPYCEEMCLNLDVGTKQSLDPGLLTKGVMLELVHFTNILTASFTPIVLGVLEHNFELDLKSQHGKHPIWFRILNLLRRRNGLITTGCEISMEFKNEPFSFQVTRGLALSNMEVQQNLFQEVTKARRSGSNKEHRREKSKDMETNTHSHHTELCPTRTSEGDHCQTGSLSEFDLDSFTGNECDKEQEDVEMEKYHTCPQGESDLDSDKVTNSGNQDHFQNPKRCSLSSDISRESEASCRNVCAASIDTTNISSSLPIVNANTKSLICQPDEKGLGGGEEQTQNHKKKKKKCDMEQEELETKNMWKLRANCVKQILSAKEISLFKKSKKFGIQFNVGFSPKQNFSVDSLLDTVLLEIARFAIAMNSSLQNFLMEILEYNFDISLENEYQRHFFTCEMMKRVRKLKDCEDAVKFSREVFELPGPIPSISMTNQSMGNINSELCSLWGMEECDVAFWFPPHSQAETEEHISQKCVDLHPFCKEINLKLHVNHTQPNKKLDINKLTYGAMTEVTSFAEKLCGTFEQICVDILKHNLDLVSQCGDSDLATSIVAQIPVALEKRNVPNATFFAGDKRRISTNVKLDSQNNLCPDAASAGSSQAAFVIQEGVNSPEMELQNNIDVKLWQLKENHIQKILLRPHEEHCPLYPYSRCKKVGIDFNVGSGVKQNLDPKLLTNGIMVELHTFVTDLLSAQKYFITEILEYNFHLYFNNELYRRAFAQKTFEQVGFNAKKKKLLTKVRFELPDTRCKPEPTFERHLYCPKCHQVRIHKHSQEESDSRHMHNPHPTTMTHADSADAKCSAQKPAKDPSSTSSEIEELIMDNYPRCKEIGLSLCVDKDKPKDKLDPHVLTHWVMVELTHFAKRMCQTKYKLINDVIQHNFNTGMQGQVVTTRLPFYRELKEKDALLSWLNEVFVIQPLPISQPRIEDEKKSPAVVHGSIWMESIKKRKLALQTKVKTDTHGKKSAPDNNYTCPLGESDLDSDKLTDSEKSGNEGELRIPKRSLSLDLSCVPTVNSYVDPWFSSQSDERGLGGVGEEQTRTPNKCDMEQEELGTENMWKLRANRVKQILSAKELSPFKRSKRFGLKFNIGFLPKQNFSVDALHDSILLEIARFAIAMNSSLQNFIMEILEYNFDISLENEYQRDIFTCEIMNRVRKLKDSEDAVKFSKEVFELHGPIPSISMTNQSVGNVNAELTSISRMEECDVACGFPPHSQAQTEEHISQKCVDLHPFCKEISLKLHVNHTQPNKKLDINKLTYGAMTEVTSFAEKLCGTFEQICVDILKHNLDLDFQCGDSDLARSIVARIPAILEQWNLSSYVNGYNNLNISTNDSTLKLNSYNNPHSDAAGAGPSQTTIIDQEVNSSPDIEHQNEFELKLWQLRANHIQQILSRPHEEHCPLYSYSRCKKVGIDFNVGSGVKQNLDPKLLTNGILVELGTFAKALVSAQKYFITETLEYNFHLDFNNELYRSAFAQKTLVKIRSRKFRRKSAFLFELPDTRCKPEPTVDRHLYCPKCYQVRNDKHRQEESGSGHMHHPHPQTRNDADSTDANCSAQKPEKDPSFNFSAIEELIMDHYPRCKEGGLSLCVDKDKPKDKLDPHVLTHWIMVELLHFAKRMCGTKYKLICDVIHHNFRTGMQGQVITTTFQFKKEMKEKDALRSWLNEVFVIQPLPISQPRIEVEKKSPAVVHGSEGMESIKKRKLALQTKVKTDTLQSVVKTSEKNHPSQGRCYREKAQKRKSTTYPMEVPGRKKSKDHFVQQARYQSDENRLHFLDGAKMNEKTLFRHEDAELPTDPETSQVGAGCGGLLQGNLHTKEEEYDPCYRNMNPEPDTEQQYYPLHGEVKMESNAAEAENPGEGTYRTS